MSLQAVKQFGSTFNAYLRTPLAQRQDDVISTALATLSKVTGIDEPLRHIRGHWERCQQITAGLAVGSCSEHLKAIARTVVHLKHTQKLSQALPPKTCATELEQYLDDPHVQHLVKKLNPPLGTYETEVIAARNLLRRCHQGVYGQKVLERIVHPQKSAVKDKIAKMILVDCLIWGVNPKQSHWFTHDMPELVREFSKFMRGARQGPYPMSDQDIFYALVFDRPYVPQNLKQCLDACASVEPCSRMHVHLSLFVEPHPFLVGYVVKYLTTVDPERALRLAKSMAESDARDIVIATAIRGFPKDKVVEQLQNLQGTDHALFVACTKRLIQVILHSPQEYSLRDLYSLISQFSTDSHYAEFVKTCVEYSCERAIAPDDQGVFDDLLQQLDGLSQITTVNKVIESQYQFIGYHGCTDLLPFFASKELVLNFAKSALAFMCIKGLTNEQIPGQFFELFHSLSKDMRAKLIERVVYHVTSDKKKTRIAMAEGFAHRMTDADDRDLLFKQFAIRTKSKEYIARIQNPQTLLHVEQLIADAEDTNNQASILAALVRRLSL